MKQFKRLQRFSAVDGSKLDVENDTRISLHTRHNIKNKYRRSHYEINTPGAIGASFSHITLWQNFLKTKDEYLIVFEDDTVVTEQELQTINALIPTLPAQWDLWLLGRHKWSFKEKPIGLTDWVTVTEFTGAHAYVLSRRGAELLVDTPFPIETHIEYYMCGCSELKGLRIIKHSMLRIGYTAEADMEFDSDTYVRHTCPTCYIPDNYHMYGLFFTYDQMAALLAIGTAAFGVFLATRRR
jgi:GR25 family glycosyltransferase involved in LPS biosynthesis